MVHHSALFEHRVAVRCSPLADDAAWLFPEELHCVRSAVPKRRTEFAAGRHTARIALAVLGEPPCPILPGTAREPMWPSGIVGSISHDASHCIVAVARKRDGYQSLGVDIEEVGELDHATIESVCRSEELDRASHEAGPVREAAKMIFSIKEAVFKCQFPITKTWLDFHDLDVTLDLANERFSAILLRDAGPIPAGHQFGGRVRKSEGHILSATWLS